MIRVFIGIPFFNHPILQTQQTDLMDLLSGSRLKWVNPQNFHVTLKFIGEIEDYYLTSLKLILRKAAKDFSPFTLEFDDIGYFGTRKEPKVIWYGLKQNKELTQLQSRIEEDIRQLGTMPADKPFHPHITLGRVRNFKDQGKLGTYIKQERKYTGESKIKSFQLIQSILTSQGPEYIEIENFTFREGN